MLEQELDEARDRSRSDPPVTLLLLDTSVIDTGEDYRR